MIVKFCKMQSLGNDFIMINMEQFSDLDEDSIAALLNAKFFRKISSRHFGIGADQVILYRFNWKSCAAQVKFFNPDGTEAEVCGNAIRCVGFLIFVECKEAKSTIFAGTRRFEVAMQKEEVQSSVGGENINANNSKKQVTVCWDSNIKIENLAAETLEDLRKICQDYKTEIVKAFVVNVGNPHLVLFVKNMPSKNIVRKLGEKFGCYPAFMPEKINVGFALRDESKNLGENDGDDELLLNLNVFERGAGSTLGCGSGAMAAAVAARKSGIIPELTENVVVHQRGGDLLVKFDKDGGLWQTGDVEYLFRGEVEGKIDAEVATNATSSRGVSTNPQRVTIYTDGACSGNPGPGGWGVLIFEDGRERIIYGGEMNTTNNRMELIAVIRALESVSKNCEVELYTDSQYVKNGITQWIKVWVRNNWKNSDRKPVKNQDLWRRLLAQTLVLKNEEEGFNVADTGNNSSIVPNIRNITPLSLPAYIPRKITWKWVKGHNGDPNNERVDALARKGCREQAY